MDGWCGWYRWHTQSGSNGGWWAAGRWVGGPEGGGQRRQVVVTRWGVCAQKVKKSIKFDENHVCHSKIDGWVMKIVSGDDK